MSNNPNFLKGKEFYKAQKFNDAIAEFSIAISKEENPYIYYERAMAYVHNNNLKLALADLNVAAELQPENPFRFSSRAYIKDLAGDTLGAVEDYEKCIALDDTDAIAHNNLGILADKLGRKEKAKKLVKRADRLAAANEYLKNIDLVKTNQLNGVWIAVILKKVLSVPLYVRTGFSPYLFAKYQDQKY
jgi:Flp pilus assembly protein TadD